MPNFEEPEKQVPIPTLLNSAQAQKRLILYFGLGFASCLTVFLTQYFTGFSFAKAAQIFPNLIRPLRGTLYLLPLITITGILTVLSTTWSKAYLSLFDLTYSGIFLLGMGLVTAGLFPGEGFLYPFVALLFLHAAVVQSRTRDQGILAAIALVSFSAGRILSFQRLSEMQRILVTENNGRGFWETFVLEALFLGAMGALSVAIAHSLSKMQGRSENKGRFDNYTIKKFLGTGGMGKVYLATHNAMCRPAALKVMQPKSEDFATALMRFEREVKLCSTLSHPNTVTIFDFGRCEDSTFYYAMECLEGFDLQKLVDKFGALPPNRVHHILHQICGSLQEAHGKNIVHRDIKPSNIFLACIGGICDFVKVLDFGLAKEMNADGANITESKVFLGTPAYVAPEMVLDPHHVDKRADIYMLGCVAFWALTARQPFTGENDAQILLEHVKSLPKWPSELTTFDIPVELERIVMRCLEKKKEDRYASISELMTALEGVPIEKIWSQVAAQEWWKNHHPDFSLLEGQIEMNFSSSEGPLRMAQ